MSTGQRSVTLVLLSIAGTCVGIGIGRPYDLAADRGQATLAPLRTTAAAAGPCCDAPAESGLLCPLEVPTVPSPEDPPVPVVRVRVRVPSCAALSEDLEYRIMVENASPAAAHHVVIKNPLPANARFVRARPEPARRTPELQWDLGTLQGGACCEITLVLRATSGADLTNCTRVQFEHGECVTTRIAGTAPPIIKEEPGKAPGKMPSTKEPPGVPKGTAKLTLEMTGPEQEYINQPASYIITIKNPGAAAATNVLIADKVPDGTKFVRADQNGQLAAGQVAWLLGTLEPGASKTVAIVLQAQSAGKICNKATAEADGGLKAAAEACTIFKGTSALLLEMVDRKDPIPVGGDTSYPIMILNQGHVPVTNIRLKAFVPSQMDFSKAEGPAKYQVGEKNAAYQVIIFEPLASLEAGAKAEFEVYVRAVQPGVARFMVELSADQLKAGGPVREQEPTTIFPENGNLPRRPGLQTWLPRWMNWAARIKAEKSGAENRQHDFSLPDFSALARCGYPSPPMSIHGPSQPSDRSTSASQLGSVVLTASAKSSIAICGSPQ